MWRGLLFGASLCHAHEDEQAMLQLHSRPRNDALGSEANPSSLISTVRQLARRATQQSPETVTALVESIDGTIQAMKLPLVTEHDAAQTLLDTQFEEITACGSMSSYTSDATAFQSLVQCRADVAAATDEKNEACELWLGEPSILQNQGDYPGCLPSIELRTAEEFLAHVEAWSTFTEAELSGLRTKKTNCETKTTVLTGEETRCAEEETEFDGAFCSRKTSCALLHACHDHEVANFDSLVNTLQSGEAARQAQFRSISQIECLLGLISTAVQDNSTIAEGQLDNCDGDANVDHLGLQVGTPQSLSDCSASAAGDPECSPVELPQLWNAGEAAQADAGEAAAQCSCSFTIDNYIAAVYLDGVDVSSTVSGPLTSWSTLKQLSFPCSTTTVFAINGADAEHGCSTGDFAMQCSSTDVNSPWNGLTADGNWKAYGSSCSSSGCQHGIANPPAGWFLPSFDDSSWASATVGGGSHGSNRVGVPGVCTSGTGWLFRSPQLGAPAPAPAGPLVTCSSMMGSEDCFQTVELAEGILPWSDRSYTLSDIAPELLGAVVYQNPVITWPPGMLFRTNQPVTLYLWNERNRDGGFPNLGWERSTGCFIWTGQPELDCWKRMVREDTEVAVSSLLVGGMFAIPL